MEHALGDLEACLAALGDSLRRDDAQCIEEASAALRRALAENMPGLQTDARRSAVAPAQHQRLATLRERVAGLREALARRNSGLERGLAVLLPQPGADVTYSRLGAPDQAPRGGLVEV